MEPSSGVPHSSFRPNKTVEAFLSILSSICIALCPLFFSVYGSGSR
jgi:hypothetical protein